MAGTHYGNRRRQPILWFYFDPWQNCHASGVYNLTVAPKFCKHVIYLKTRTSSHIGERMCWRAHARVYDENVHTLLKPVFEARQG